MAQHIPIEAFKQKQMRQIEKSIRNQRYFKTSMKFELQDVVYKETKDDEVYGTVRTAPKSITGIGKEYFEVHTKPAKYGRKVTNIYLVA